MPDHRPARGFPMRFNGSAAYVSTEDLTLAVNAAIALERPLLVKGEPGTGKTMLAVEVAGALGLPLLEWHIKSTTKAQQGLYEYDAVSRLRDVTGLKTPPSPSELLDWLKLPLAESIPVEALRSKDRKTTIPPLHGALLKNEQDVHLFERLIFMSRQRS